MRKIAITNMRKIKKAIPLIENKVKVKISFGKNEITIKGSELNEYLIEQVISAIDFGFDAESALLLLNEDFVLEFIEIKEHTRRKNLKDIRGRIIGRDGKVRKTIERLTGAEIVINENTVGVIVDSDHLDAIVQAIENLIHGAKHGNVFAYLEKQNVSMRKFDKEDLGLKDKALKDIDLKKIEEGLNK